VFGATDPVRRGVVASMNRPGGNVTGFAALSVELSGKQLGLLHDLVPKIWNLAILGQSMGCVPADCIL
jgi:putative ABC transport system substrate-binding protein